MAVSRGILASGVGAARVLTARRAVVRVFVKRMLLFVDCWSGWFGLWLWLVWSAAFWFRGVGSTYVENGIKKALIKNLTIVSLN